MKTFLFVLAATIFEAAGDAIVRIALHHQSLSARIGLFLVGYTLLALYGTSLNLAPVEVRGRHWDVCRDAVRGFPDR